MIETSERDGIAIVQMKHGKASALDLEFCAALVEQFERLGKSDVRATVLTGQGRIFSAGVDLLRLSDGGTDYIRRFLPALHALYDTVFHHPKPLVAAINGHAIAGGCVLACCADRRIMAHDSGRIGVTEMLVGVPFPALAFEIVRFAAPPRHLAEFTLSGATYASADALERGWVNEVVEPEALLDRAMTVAKQLAAMSPSAFAQTKRQIRQAVDERMACEGAAVDKAVTEIWTRPETLERVRDYVARTFKK